MRFSILSIKPFQLFKMKMLTILLTSLFFPHLLEGSDSLMIDYTNYPDPVQYTVDTPDLPLFDKRVFNVLDAESYQKMTEAEKTFFLPIIAPWREEGWDLYYCGRMNLVDTVVSLVIKADDGVEQGLYLINIKDAAVVSRVKLSQYWYEDEMNYCCFYSVLEDGLIQVFMSTVVTCDLYEDDNVEDELVWKKDDTPVLLKKSIMNSLEYDCVGGFHIDNDGLICPVALPAAPADSVATEESVPEEVVTVKPPKTFMIGIWGGGGYRTNRIDPQLTGADRDYVAAMKWGYDFGADALYYFSDWGLGLRYSSLRSHHNGRASFVGDGKAQTGDVDSHSNIWFLGPTVALRDTYGTKGNSLYVLYGLGYMGYKLESEIPSYYPQTATGGTVGYCIDLGMDFRLTERAYFSVALSYYSGMLRRYKLTNGNLTQEIALEDDETEGLNYLALDFGLHWYLGK